MRRRRWLLPRIFFGEFYEAVQQVAQAAGDIQVCISVHVPRVRHSAHRYQSSELAAMLANGGIHHSLRECSKKSHDTRPPQETDLSSAVSPGRDSVFLVFSSSGIVSWILAGCYLHLQVPGTRGSRAERDGATMVLGLP